MVRNERTDLGDASLEILSQSLEEFRLVSERMSANGGKLSRRDFMYLSGAGLLSVFLSACKTGTLTPTSEPPKTALAPTIESPKPSPTVVATKESPKSTATRPPELTPTTNENYPKKLADLKVVNDLPMAEFAKKYTDQGLQKELEVLKAKWVEGLKAIGVKEQDAVFGINEYSWDNGKGYSWIMCVTGKSGEVYVPRDSVSHTRMIDFSAYTSAIKDIPFTVEKLQLPEFHNFEYEVVHGRSEKGWMGMLLLKKGTKEPMAWYDMRADVAQWKDVKEQPVILKASIQQELEKYSVEEQKLIDELRAKLATATEKGMFYASTQGKIEDENGFCWPVKIKDITMGIRDCYLPDGKTKKVAVSWRRDDGAYLLEGSVGGFVVAKIKERGARLMELNYKMIQPEVVQALSGSWERIEKTYLGVECVADGTVFLPYMKGGCYVDKRDLNLLAFDYLPKRNNEKCDSVAYWKLRNDVEVSEENVTRLINKVDFLDDNQIPIDRNSPKYKDRADKVIAALNLCWEIFNDREKRLILSLKSMSFILSDKPRYFFQKKVDGTGENIVQLPIDFLNERVQLGNRSTIEALLGVFIHEWTHAVSQQQADNEFQAHMNELGYFGRRNLLWTSISVSTAFQLRNGGYS